MSVNDPPRSIDPNIDNGGLSAWFVPPTVQLSDTYVLLLRALLFTKEHPFSRQCSPTVGVRVFEAKILCFKITCDAVCTENDER